MHFIRMLANINNMKSITLICLFFLFSSNTKNEDSIKYLNSNDKEFKTLEIYGSSFQIGSQGCSIDGKVLPCKLVTKALNKYKKTLGKCTPCWLKEYHYVNREINREGYAIKVGKDIFHKMYFGEYLEYNESGDTSFHKKDTSLNLKTVSLLKPNRIQPYLIKNKNFTYQR